jgi:hypothetical protein
MPNMAGIQMSQPIPMTIPIHEPQQMYVQMAPANNGSFDNDRKMRLDAITAREPKEPARYEPSELTSTVQHYFLLNLRSLENCLVLI